MDDAQHEGFTLVELMVVLALIALLVGMAAPAMARFLDNARLRAATEDVTRELVQARSHAYTFHKPVFFRISVTGAAWCYGWGETPECDCNNNNTDLTCRYRTSSDYPKIQLSLPASQGSFRLLRFAPVRGTATATSFSLENRTRQTRVIVSLLGRIRTCSPDTTGYLAC